MLEFYLVGVLSMAIMNYSKISHPIFMGASVLFIFILVSLVLCFKSSLFIFTIFMGFVGGVLIIYAYAIAVVPYSNSNEKYEGQTLNLIDNLVLSKSKYIFTFICCSLAILLCIVVGQTKQVYTQYMATSFFSLESHGIMILYMGCVLLATMVVAINMCSQMCGALVEK